VRGDRRVGVVVDARGGELAAVATSGLYRSRSGWSSGGRFAWRPVNGQVLKYTRSSMMRSSSSSSSSVAIAKGTPTRPASLSRWTTTSSTPRRFVRRTLTSSTLTSRAASQEFVSATKRRNALSPLIRPRVG
jgi:hypothetical protein